MGKEFPTGMEEGGERNIQWSRRSKGKKQWVISKKFSYRGPGNDLYWKGLDAVDVFSSRDNGGISPLWAGTGSKVRGMLTFLEG